MSIKKHLIKRQDFANLILMSQCSGVAAGEASQKLSAAVLRSWFEGFGRIGWFLVVVVVVECGS